MALDDEEAQRGAAPEVRIGGSVAVELEWVMAAAFRPESHHPSITRLFAESPELERRVRTLWPHDQPWSWGEMGLIILAHHGGLLFSLDPDLLLGHLESLCANAPTALSLASETEARRRVILSRLQQLRSSTELRHRYVDVVRDLWSAVSGEWRHTGLPAVDAMVRARGELKHRGAPWQEVARNPRKPWKPACLQLANALPEGGVLALVPAYHARLAGYLDLPGALLISIPAESGAAEARARTELLARRLRAISDPTRLAMLDVLRNEPSTVTELAEGFHLAQPTVSNHVKLLRDAGLVEQRPPRDGRRVLGVGRDALHEVVQHLQGMLGEREDGTTEDRGEAGAGTVAAREGLDSARPPA